MQYIWLGQICDLAARFEEGIYSTRPNYSVACFVARPGLLP